MREVKRERERERNQEREVKKETSTERREKSLRALPYARLCTNISRRLGKIPRGGGDTKN